MSGGAKRSLKAVLRALAAPVRRLNRRRTARRMRAETGIRRKEVPNDLILPQVRQVIREGYTATINVKGYSMRPFLEHCRDKVTLAPFQTLRKGDAVLAEVAPGKFVLHRIVCIEGDAITLMGDGNLRGVEHCRYGDVAGVVTSYWRNGRTLSASNRWLRGSVVLWRGLLPVRRYLLFIYRLFI